MVYPLQHRRHRPQEIILLVDVAVAFVRRYRLGHLGTIIPADGVAVGQLRPGPPFPDEKSAFRWGSPHNRFKITDAFRLTSSQSSDMPVAEQNSWSTCVIRKDSGVSNTPETTSRIITIIT